MLRIVKRCSVRACVCVCASWNRSKYGKSSLVSEGLCVCVHAYVCVCIYTHAHTRTHKIHKVYTCVYVCVRERCRQIGIPLAGPMEVQHFISMSHTRCTGPRPDDDEGDVHVAAVSWSQVALLGAPIRLVGISGPVDGRRAYTRYVILL